MITFVCWKWAGWRRKNYYTAEHVNTLARMLKANVKIPYKLVCITDDPEGITECETFPLWPDETGIPVRSNQPHCYTRLRLFDKEIGEQLGETLVSIDLDTVILSDITDLVTVKDDIRFARGTVSHLQGSFFLHKAGLYTRLWEDFTPDAPSKVEQYIKKTGKRAVGSDQAWMTSQLGNIPTWGPEHGIYYYRQFRDGTPLPDNAKLIFFPGQIKPWHMDVYLTHPEVFIQYRKYQNGIDSSKHSGQSTLTTC